MTSTTGLLLTAAIACGVGACSDSAAPAAPLTTPPFIFVADVGGFATLMKYDGGVQTPLTSGSNNDEPNSAGGRLVFTSRRDVWPQIYIADLGVTTVRRVTNSTHYENAASLSPRGDSIAFVSTRSGTPRIWVINAPALTATTFDAPVALATGSPDYVPESGPAWSPRGGLIAFTSTRDGVSQLFVMPSGGGTPTKITSELGGAFTPTWSPDGATIYYVAAVPSLEIRKVSASGGYGTTVVDVAHAGDLDAGGPITCGAGLCLFSTSAAVPAGDMFLLPASGALPQIVFPRTAAMERQPAILVP